MAVGGLVGLGKRGAGPLPPLHTLLRGSAFENYGHLLYPVSNGASIGGIRRWWKSRREIIQTECNGFPRSRLLLLYLLYPLFGFSCVAVKFFSSQISLQYWHSFICLLFRLFAFLRVALKFLSSRISLQYSHLLIYLVYPLFEVLRVSIKLFSPNNLTCLLIFYSSLCYTSYTSLLWYPLWALLTMLGCHHSDAIHSVMPPKASPLEPFRAAPRRASSRHTHGY